MARAFLFLACGLLFVSLGVMLPEPTERAHVARVVGIGVSGTDVRQLRDAPGLFIPPSTKLVAPAAKAVEPQPSKLDERVRIASAEKTHKALQARIFKATRGEQAGTASRANDRRPITDPVTGPATGPVTEPALETVPGPIATLKAVPTVTARSKIALSAAASSRPKLTRQQRYDLALRLQRRLKQAGCYRGAVDGIWGKGSRAAMGRFNSAINSRLSVNEPSDLLLTVVRSRSGQVCGGPSETTTQIALAAKRQVAAKPSPVKPAPNGAGEGARRASPALVGGRIVVRRTVEQAVPRKAVQQARAADRVVTPASNAQAAQPVTARTDKAVRAQATVVANDQADAAKAASLGDRKATTPAKAASDAEKARKRVAARKRLARKRALRRARARKARARARARQRRVVQRQRTRRAIRRARRGQIFAFQPTRRRFRGYRSRGTGPYASQPRWARDAFTGNN